MNFKLYRWIGKYTNEYVTDQHCEILIYAESVEHARKIYGKNRLKQFDWLIETDNYITDDSPALRMLLHYRFGGHKYMYVPTITLLYMDNDFKKPKIDITKLLDL